MTLLLLGHVTLVEHFQLLALRSQDRMLREGGGVEIIKLHDDGHRYKLANDIKQRGLRREEQDDEDLCDDSDRCLAESEEECAEDAPCQSLVFIAILWVLLLIVSNHSEFLGVIQYILHYIYAIFDIWLANQVHHNRRGDSRNDHMVLVCGNDEKSCPTLEENNHQVYRAHLH